MVCPALISSCGRSPPLHRFHHNRLLPLSRDLGHRFFLLIPIVHSLAFLLR